MMMVMMMKTTTNVSWFVLFVSPLLTAGATTLPSSNTISSSSSSRNSFDDGAIILGQVFFDAIAQSFERETEIEKSDESKNLSSSNQNIHDEYSLRHLDYIDGSFLAKYAFPECVNEALSPEECKTLIEDQIDTAGGHEVGDVQVKIHVPRTAEQFAESYWMVEVPTNLRGNVACDRNDGIIVYPFEWMDGTTGLANKVEDEDCYGLTAGQCCLNLRERSRSLTISGYDHQGQCLSCFVYQEPLEPVLNHEVGRTEYLDCTDVVFQGKGSCSFERLRESQVDYLDEDTANRIEKAISSLESFKENRSCDIFDQLLEELYDAAVVIKPLSIKVGRLACSICYGEQDISLEDDFVTALLMEILNLLQKNSPPPSSKENCIIIYTDQQGDIALEPTLGGSRSESGPKNSYCNDDADCALDEEWCDTLINACRTYRDIGDQCGDDYFYFDDFYGKCNPSEAVCINVYRCTEEGDLRALNSKVCAASGKEGPCTTAADCNDNEYCDKTNSRCLVNRNEGECCDEEINNCGFDETGRNLVCGPDTDPGAYYPPYYTCRRQCETDDDCIEDDEKCVPDIDDEFPLVEKYCTAYY